ncbi:probable Mediator of RNA polymerase II transcription subunit 31 [Ustilago trichophora]|uniref:Mediator of RNA polymerase II transcription subunit 31 n=1 Tax=Ustilago trichophora TaxID=86804 RepID=A0A5C3EKT8_9BASI|nr:probable Mediator of RNA polymerase II transcription subunit 31 [Ustilago trichophora]
MTTTNDPTDSDSLPAVDLQKRAENQSAFSRDLEFLSSLANPFYLNHLAISGVLSTPAFLRYLKYLDYFRHPKYVKYLQYPQALHFLDLLQNEEGFRLACRDPGFVGEVMAKQVGHWGTWRAPEGEDGEGGADGEGDAQVQT